MKPGQREKLLDLMQRYGIGYFDYAGPDGAITLEADRPEQDHAPIVAPKPGIFLWSHPIDREAAIWPRRVRSGEIIGWLKIGPLLEPVLATEDAPIRRPKLADGTLAGYGDRLF
ncbi:hypothetical protein [Rhizobium sp.]